MSTTGPGASCEALYGLPFVNVIWNGAIFLNPIADWQKAEPARKTNRSSGIIFLVISKVSFSIRNLGFFYMGKNIFLLNFKLLMQVLC